MSLYLPKTKGEREREREKRETAIYIEHNLWRMFLLIRCPHRINKLLLLSQHPSPLTSLSHPLHDLPHLKNHLKLAFSILFQPKSKKKEIRKEKCKARKIKSQTATKQEAKIVLTDIKVGKRKEKKGEEHRRNGEKESKTKIDVLQGERVAPNTANNENNLKKTVEARWEPTGRGKERPIEREGEAGQGGKQRGNKNCTIISKQWRSPNNPAGSEAAQRGRQRGRRKKGSRTFYT